MQNFIFLLLFYVLILIVWLALCLVIFAISYLIRKNLSSILLWIHMVINYLIYFALGIWGLSLYWNAFIHKQWIIFIFLLIFGSIIIGFYQAFASLIIVPFALISTYFVEKTETLKPLRDEYKVDVISAKGKVIESYESDDLINKKLATFFLLDFFGHLLYFSTHPQQYKAYGWWDYIFTPFFFLIQGIGLFILFVLIYNRLKHGNFIYNNWKYVITQTLKLDFFITIALQVLAIGIYIFFPQ